MVDCAPLPHPFFGRDEIELHEKAYLIYRWGEECLHWWLKIELSGVTVLESLANNDDEDANLGAEQGRLTQKAGEGDRYFIKLIDCVSRIEKSLNSLEKYL